MSNNKGWFKPSDNKELKYKWYNSKGEVIYMDDEIFKLCSKVHNTTTLASEEGLYTYRVNPIQNLSGVLDITR